MKSSDNTAHHKKLKLHMVESSETVESFGWGDFPLITMPATVMSVDSESDVGVWSQQSQHKRKDHPSTEDEFLSQTQPQTAEAEVVSLGWADFPCVDYSDVMRVSSDNGASDSSISTELTSTGDEIIVDEDALSTTSSKYVPARSNSKVKFSDAMQVREFDVTSVDHPQAEKFCLSLDWNHKPTVIVTLPGDDDVWNKHPPRRLSEPERRERLADVLTTNPPNQLAMEVVFS